MIGKIINVYTRHQLIGSGKYLIIINSDEDSLLSTQMHACPSVYIYIYIYIYIYMCVCVYTVYMCDFTSH